MKRIVVMVLCMALVLGLAGCGADKEQVGINADVGTWKTAQTIQPFFYQEHLSENDIVNVAPFTNPGDMKTALLAGSLDMCKTRFLRATSTVLTVPLAREP